MSHHDRMFHHEHAYRLDDPERRTWLPPDEVLQRLALRPGMVVADIGAGTGYFAIPMARAVMPGGKLYAVDVQTEMLARLRAVMPAGSHVELVEAEAAHTRLPDASQDLVFISDVWHELDSPPAFLVEVARVLRPGGRLAILDWRADVSSPLGPPHEHRVAESDVVRLLANQGFASIEEGHVGTYSYLVLAVRPGRA